MKIIFTLLLLIMLAIGGSTSVLGDQGNDQSSTESEAIPEDLEPVPEPEEKKGWLKSYLERQKEKDPNRGRILPIPVFITEPAIGEGLGLAIAYFHRKREVSNKDRVASMESLGRASSEQEAPPTVTAAFGAYTSNETAAAGVGHMNTFKDDHIRFTGAAAWANINSTFYLADQPFKFNLKGVLAYQETRFRFGESRWFWGIGLTYLNADTAFRVELPDETPVELFPNTLTNVGLAAKLAWDSRDSTSMPNKGQFVDLSLWRYDDAIGGDYNYWNAKLKMTSFHPFGEKWVLGLRLDYNATSGNAPFFGYPYVSLRGIPALRYQGDRVVTGEIDIAKGPEDYNWYIQVGHAW